MATLSKDSALQAFARRYRAMTGSNFGPISAEARATAAALAEGETLSEMDDHSGGLHPLMIWGTLLKWSDDFPRARVLFKRALSEIEGRDESLRAPVLFHLAEMEVWAGDWLLAAVYLRECDRSVLHSGQRSYVCLPLTAEAMLRCCRGDLDPARATAELALAAASGVGNDPYVSRALATLGAIELVAGSPARANDWFERLRAHPGNVGRVRSEGDEVEALLAVGRFAEAEVVLGRFQDYDDPWERAIGSRIRAVVAASRGDTETSIREFEAALRHHEDLPMPLELARTLVAYGAVLRRSKQKRAAREKLEQACAIMTSLGAHAWLGRAEAELDRIAPAPTSAGELTPTESRIAQLVAGGRTNKEVAAELFLSVKTVEANLSRIYDKLGVRSRSELAGQIGIKR
jgi:DNA-binding CsgD family transcriptional regulator